MARPERPFEPLGSCGARSRLIHSQAAAGRCPSRAPCVPGAGPMPRHFGTPLRACGRFWHRPRTGRGSHQKETDMPAGITDSDTMFSVRVKPWHGLGAVLERPPASAAEAIECSGLGWSVARQPIAIHRGGTPPDWARPASEAISGFYATVRQDTGEVLGIVGERYRIVQNHEAFGPPRARGAARARHLDRLLPAVQAARRPARLPALHRAAGSEWVISRWDSHLPTPQTAITAYADRAV